MTRCTALLCLCPVAFPLSLFSLSLSVQQQIGLPICSARSLSLSARTDVYQAVHLSPPNNGYNSRASGSTSQGYMTGLLEALSLSL